MNVNIIIAGMVYAKVNLHFSVALLKLVSFWSSVLRVVVSTQLNCEAVVGGGLLQNYHSYTLMGLEVDHKDQIH